MVVAFYASTIIFCAVWAMLDWNGFREQMRRNEVPQGPERSLLMTYADLP